MSKGRFGDPNDPTLVWGVEGKSTRTFHVPVPRSLLISFDLDRLPVELWRVGTLTRIDPFYEDGMTWFAESGMSELVTTSTDLVSGIDFNDIATFLLPAAGGWMGAPVELNENQIVDIFDALGWDHKLRQ